MPDRSIRWTSWTIYHSTSDMNWHHHPFDLSISVHMDRHNNGIAVQFIESHINGHLFNTLKCSIMARRWSDDHGRPDPFDLEGR